MSTLRFVRRKSPVVYSLFSVVLLVLLVTQPLTAKPLAQGVLPHVREADGQADQAKIQADIAKLPISFIANTGQVDASVRFMVKAGTQTIFFTPQQVVFAASEKTEDEDTQSSVVRLCFTGANGEVKLEATQPLPGVANFFLGNDQENWQTNVATYATITYQDLYPGIDLIYSGKQGRLKSEFVVSPGADPTVILMGYSGTSDMYVRDDGALVLETPIGELVEAPPLIYQVIDEQRVTVEGGYRLLGDGEVTFSLGEYLTTEPLVIDPILVYSTYLGGSGSDEGHAIAVDGSGNAYVTGDTYSTDFPTQNPLQPNHGGSTDAFVTKLNSTGSALIYSTYLGGSDTDTGYGIAVDSSGNAYITGYTSSTDFPTQNPLQSDFGGGSYDAFITKFNSTGSALIYSTYLGGESGDNGYGIAVDGSGNAYITGYTTSTNFPTQNPLQPDYGGSWDVFVTKLNASGSALVYSTYLGGNNYDDGAGIAVDGSGNAYITGYTRSTNFPTQNALQSAYGGGDYDAFVAKLNPSGSALIYSTYLGGSGWDYGHGIAVDGSGNAYVTGDTYSSDFPTQNPLQPSFSGGYSDAFVAKLNSTNYSDAFVAKLNSTGSALIYSTYLGGSSHNDCGYGIAVDGSGNAYITGWTSSINFPTQNPLQPNHGGSTDAFVTKLNSTGSALIYSTYLGGNNYDHGWGIAVDGSGNAYVTGLTYSADFPTQNPLQPSFGGGYSDAFVAKIGAGAVNKPPLANAGPDQTLTDTDSNGSEGVTLNGSGSDDPDGTIATWVWTEGGGQIATGETPIITLSVGTHTITLTVTDNDTATDTDEVTIVIASGHLPPKKVPVLLVHGFQLLSGYDPGELWREMADVLADSGLAVYISDYAKRKKTSDDIRSYAAVLTGEIEAIRVFENAEQVDIVAHSMGGLVARAYIESTDFIPYIGQPEFPDYHLSYEGDVRKLIMLGTPNHGALLAWLASLLGGGKSAQQMHLGSNFLDILNHGCRDCGGEDEIVSSVEYIVFAGQECDECVSLSIPLPSPGLFPMQATSVETLFSCLEKCRADGEDWKGDDGRVSMESTKLDNAKLHACISADHTALRTQQEICEAVRARLLSQPVGNVIWISDVLQIACPVHITVTDQYGREINDAGTDEIPGTSITKDEESGLITIYLNPDLDYDVYIEAYENGTFTLVELLQTQNEGFVVNLFKDVSVVAGTTAQITVIPSQTERLLEIDFDGDGTVDEIQEPNEENTIPDIPIDLGINHGPNPVPDTGIAFFYSLPVGTSTAKLMVFSATSSRLLFETSINVDETRFPASGTWDPVDNDGVKLANGPYLYVLIANGQLIGQGKMVIQR